MLVLVYFLPTKQKRFLIWFPLKKTSCDCNHPYPKSDLLIKMIDKVHGPAVFFHVCGDLHNRSLL